MRWNKLAKLLKYFAIFITSFLLLTTFWIISNYDSNATLNAIIFHLKMPLDGVNTIFYTGFIIYVIIPSIIILICSFYMFSFIVLLLIGIGLTTSIFGFNQTYYNAVISLKSKYYASFLFNDEIGIFFILKLILIILSCYIATSLIYKYCKKIHINWFYIITLIIITIYSIDKHFQIYTTIFKRQYSTLYEDHYKIKDDIHTKKPRNLILIIAESMETIYAHGGLINNKNNTENLIPNLYKLAKNNINFSNNNNFGGLYQTNNTSWTIAGTTGYLCGVPLSLPIDSTIIFLNNLTNQSQFIKNATCISDILKKNNYNQVAFLGYDTSFAGSKHFFQSHNIDILDEKDFKKYGELKYGFWGIKDSQIFEFTKDYLNNYHSNLPFAIYIPTVDTHFPGGFTDREYCKNIKNNSLDDAIKCSDKIIYDFVSWVMKQDFYNNTTIIILGDHLSGLSLRYENRNIYNVFINPKFSKNINNNLVKYRILSHFDMTPLILDSIGFKVEYFGLGRNPLYSKTLLEEYGLKEINDLIIKDSKFYRSLWE